MTAKRFKLRLSKFGNGLITDTQKKEDLYFDKEFLDTTLPKANEWLNKLADENEQLKKDLKRCKEWINSDKCDYETALAFIKSKGYSLKDVLEYKGDMK